MGGGETGDQDRRPAVSRPVRGHMQGRMEAALTTGAGSDRSLRQKKERAKMDFRSWTNCEENAEDFCSLCEKLYRDTINGTPIRYYIIFDGKKIRTHETLGYSIPEDVWRGDAMIVAMFGGDAEHGFVRQWMEADGSAVEADADGTLRCGDYTAEDAIDDMVIEAMADGAIPTPWMLDDWICGNVINADVRL